MDARYPYDPAELTARQIRTTKRMASAAKIVAAGYVVLRMVQLASPWPNAGKLFNLRVPATVPAEEVPAIGSAITIRNRESGIDLGIYRIIPATAGDELWAHPLTQWELCSLSDHRASGKATAAAQPATAAAQPATVPATAALQTALANRVSTRERVSHYPPAQPAQPASEQATVPAQPASAGKRGRK